MHKFVKIDNTTYYFDLDSDGKSVSIAEGGHAKVYKGSLEYTPTRAGGEIVKVAVAYKRMKLKDNDTTEHVVEECLNMAYFNGVKEMTSKNFYPNNHVHENMIKLYACIFSPRISKHTIAMEFMDESVHSYTICVEKKHKTDVQQNYIRKGDFFTLSTDDRMECIKTFMKGTLGGLAFMHANNAVHADLKGENILITKFRDGPNKNKIDKVKICDLDSAFDLGDQNLISAEICTIGYRAPELFVKYIALDLDSYNSVAEGHQIVLSEKLDVYSCGVELYRLLYKVACVDETTTKLKCPSSTRLLRPMAI